MPLKIMSPTLRSTPTCDPLRKLRTVSSLQQKLTRKAGIPACVRTVCTYVSLDTADPVAWVDMSNTAKPSD